MMNSQIPRLSVLVASLALPSARTISGVDGMCAPLLELLVVRGLLHEVEDLPSACWTCGTVGGTYLVGELRVGEREGLGVRGRHGVDLLMLALMDRGGYVLGLTFGSRAEEGL
jgi:hypothetical protein